MTCGVVHLKVSMSLGELYFFQAAATLFPYLHKEPVKPLLAQGLCLCKAEQAAADIRPHVVQVGVHGIRPPPEVQVVGKVDCRLLLELLCHLQTDIPVCYTRACQQTCLGEPARV